METKKKIAYVDKEIKYNQQLLELGNKQSTREIEIMKISTKKSNPQYRDNYTYHESKNVTTKQNNRNDVVKHNRFTRHFDGEQINENKPMFQKVLEYVLW